VINRERAQRLIDEGRMKPAGLAEYEAAKADGRLEDAYAPQRRAAIPEDFQAELNKHPEAHEFFQDAHGRRSLLVPVPAPSHQGPETSRATNRELHRAAH